MDPHYRLITHINIALVCQSGTNLSAGGQRRRDVFTRRDEHIETLICFPLNGKNSEISTDGHHRWINTVKS